MTQLKANITPPINSRTALITGDAWTLKTDLDAFYRLNVAHETFCINRSITAPWVKGFHHWGQADADEALWFAGWIRKEFPAVWRHTLKPGPETFNVFWDEGDGQDVVEWHGGTLRMAIEICDALGYERIMLAGCPILNGSHWYDPTGCYVNWLPETIKFWEAYKNPRVRSMSGFTRYLFGGPEDWNR
jgi:hypothetical protein